MPALTLSSHNVSTHILELMIHYSKGSAVILYHRCSQDTSVTARLALKSTQGKQD